METNSAGYWARLWAALMGRNAGLPVRQPSMNGCPPPDEQTADCRARVATLEMELAEQNGRITQMRSEYEALQLAKERALAGAGQEQMERLFKKLAGTLANLAALTAMAEAGRDVQVADLVQLIKNFEKELARAGLEPIGKAGEKTRFEAACHQRMSGAAVQSGVPVTIHIPGYRMGQKVLLKAMVSTREE